MTSALRFTKLGATLVLQDGEYVVAQITSAGVTLRSKHDHSCRIVAVAELPSVMDPVANPPADLMRNVRALDHLSDAQTRALASREAHLMEVLYGVPLPGGTPRSEYDPQGPSLETRIQRKSEELTKAGIAGWSVRNIKRQIATLRGEGPAGLIDRRAGRSEKAYARVDSRVIDAMVELKHQRVNESTVTRETLQVSLEKLLAKRYPGEQIQMPAKTARNLYWRQLTHGSYTFGDAPGRRSTANAPERVFKSRRALLIPGSEVQMDTTHLDNYVRGWNGKPISVVLGILMDKASRSILAAAVMPTAMKAADQTLLLARCLVPDAQRPLTPIDPHDVATLPGLEHLTAEAADLANRGRPYIIPRELVTDNGADYRSAALRSAAQRCGITLVRASVHTPTDKAMVERAFRTIKDNLLSLLPGFTGGSVSKRGKAPESNEGLLDIFTLQVLVDRFISIVYQNTLTEGLRDPYDPSIELSPNAAYLAMYDFAGGFPIPLGTDDYIAMLPVKRQCILRDGITINYRRYDCEQLNPLREQYDRHTGKSRRWEIHWDPYDPQAVWIEDPDTGAWIQCQWMNQDVLSEPFSREIRANARKIRAAVPSFTREESHRAAASIVEDSMQAQRKKDRLELARELRKKQAPITTDAPGRRRRPPLTQLPKQSVEQPSGRFEPWRDRT